MFALCIKSSHARGMGHLFRALTLGQALVAKGHAIRFLVNEDPVAISVLAERGVAAEPVNLLDWTSGWETELIARLGIRVWVNDRLDTDARHAERVKSAGLPLITFDDRGDGAAMADLNVAALAFDGRDQLRGRQVLVGPRYLILNQEIVHFRRVRTEAVPLLVTLGGSDTWGATVKVVELLARRGLAATIVVGPSFGHHHELAQVLTSAMVLKRGVPSLIAEMSRHGLAVTGGGITAFEANALGLPAIVVANEAHEIPIGRALEAFGGAIFAGHHTAIDISILDRELPIEAMSRAGLAAIDGRGTNRVIAMIEELMT